MKLSWQYLAGFFDGEGCLYISRQKGKKKNPYYTPRVVIANTNEEVIGLIEKSFHGSTAREGFEIRPGRRRPWYVEIYRRDRIKKFLKGIYPYSIVKKKQIELMFEFIKHLDKSKSGKPVADEIIVWREKQVQKLKDLKKEK